MKEALSSISGIVGSPWTALVLVGVTIVVIFMAYQMNTVNPSPSNAKTTEEIISPVGSWNLNVRLLTQEETSALLSTKSMEQRIRESNMPRSHSECWCNSSKKRGISNA